MSTTPLVQVVGALDDALDRLERCLCERVERRLAGREMIELAAHDVLRAWVQTRRRTQELERSIAETATLALDLAALALATEASPDLGWTGSLSPQRGVASPREPRDIQEFHRLAPPGGIGGGR